MDFTLKKYQKLLQVLGSGDFTLGNYLNHRVTQKFILRHDVDAMPQSALSMAKLEKKFNVKSTYYFRIPRTFRTRVIEKIYRLGHEIGYHYETLAKTNGDYMAAKRLFILELKKFEKWKVSTAAMHGSPFSRFNNLNLVKKYGFRELGLVSEAYLSVDFNEMKYVTDTGRAWNNPHVSVRDKVDTDMPSISDTNDLVQKLNIGTIERACLVIHPQRWQDRVLYWSYELIWQNLKNIGKMVFSRVRS